MSAARSRARREALWWARLCRLALLDARAGRRRSSPTCSSTGVGVWGLNRTVGWGFDITNFVFWVGIGHAGTLISAVLFLFRQRGAQAVNRAAEAMTLIAVMCAGHLPAHPHGQHPWLALLRLPLPELPRPAVDQLQAPLSAGTSSRSRPTFLISLGFLVRRPRPRPGHPARPRGLQDEDADPLRRLLARLGRLERRLAPLRDGLPAAGGTRDAARLFGAHDRQHGLRHLGHPRLAHDDLSALLRGGSDLLRFGDGAHADADRPQDDASRGLHHRPPRRAR